ncbi:MAG: tRNA (adenosine(37)-N6)-threonylcarbamoyltransferase complex ATPase subunit type 1 TsaE, partial [bacterium]|nr:tRNA (adenosine(37)-N6)-threonylcarbamoyltransferase complex ATPase subunit type 1 TsaE [bacterium]
GESLGEQLKGSEVILLKGDLGAGKTLLTKGIAAALGIEPEEVVSPTFTLVNEYRGPDNRRFFHIDLYRLGPSAADTLPEIDDYIDEGIIVIEWAQFLEPSYFQMDRIIDIDFQLSQENDDARTIHIDTQLKYIDLAAKS